MNFFKPMLTKLAVAGAIAFSALHAQAAAVQIDFQGTISSITHPDFSTLLSVGQAVSATAVFNVSPPDAFSGMSDGVNPGDSLTVGGAPVTGFTLSLAGQGSSYVFYDFRGGSGPSAVVGSNVIDVDGIYLKMDGINGFTATLADYLALPSTAFTAVLIGEWTGTGGGA